MPDTEQLLARLTAHALYGARRPHDIGSMAENLPEMDWDTLSAELGRLVHGPFRLAVLNYRSAKPRTRKDMAFTYDETQANRWRNDTSARDGVPLFILSQGSVTKLKSLQSSVAVINDRDLRRCVRDEATGWLDNPMRKALWEHIVDNSDDFTLNGLLDFAAAAKEIMDRSNRIDLPECESKNLWRLGLFPYKGLGRLSATQPVTKHLRDNHSLVQRIRTLTKKDRQMVAALLSQAEERSDAEGLAPLAQGILRFARSKSNSDLSGLEFSAVAGILRPRRNKKRHEKGEDTEADRKARRVEGDEAGILDVIETGGVNLDTIDSSLNPSLNDEDDAQPIGVEVGEDTLLPRLRMGTSLVNVAIRRLISSEIFGGVVTCIATDALGCLKALEARSATVREFRPLEIQQPPTSVSAILQKALITYDLPPEHQQVWLDYLDARTALLPLVEELSDHPFITLFRDRELLAKAERLIKAYGDLLTAIDDVRQKIMTTSHDAARQLAGGALALDVIVLRYRAGDDAESYNTVALAGPLHPFHLWRWTQIVRVAREFREELRQFNELQIAQFSRPVVSSPHLLVSNYLVPEARGSWKFVGVGNLGGLPFYSEPQSRVVSWIRAEGISKIVEKFLSVAVHAKYGLEIIFIDPPSLSDVLDSVLAINRRRRRDDLVPIHVRVFHTRPVPVASDEEDERLEDLAEAMRVCKGTLDVNPDPVLVGTLAKKIEQRKAHLTVFFEPGEAVEFSASMDSTPRSSPFLLPRQYKYDPVTEQFEVIIAGDASEFGGYFSLFQDLLQLPRNQIIGRRAGAQQWKTEIAEIGKHTMWFCIIDQGIEPTFSIPGAITLGRSMLGDRDLLTFTSHGDTMERFLMRLVEQAGLVPDTATCRRTGRLIRHLGGDTLSLTVEAASSTGQLAPTQSIGLMGVLAAVNWYEQEQPDTLLISLDTDLARAWILGAHDEDHRHGDLIALRQTNQGVCVEVTEVKVREDAGTVVRIAQEKRSGYRATGTAVDQIDNTVTILRRILSPNPNPLDRTRREILRDQFYQGVATQEMDPDRRRRLVSMLEEFFGRGARGGTVGHVFVVRIATGESWQVAPIDHGEGQSPQDNLILAHRITLAEELDDRSHEQPAADSSRIAKASQRKGTRASTEQEMPAVTPESQSRQLEATKQAGEPAMSVRATENTTQPASAPTPDGVSILIGKDPTGQEITWDTRINPAFGILITGDTGFGKTQTLRAIIAELRTAGYPVMIFDYKPDYGDKEFIEAHQLRVYDVSRYGLPFNPMALIPDQTGEVWPNGQAYEFAAILTRLKGFGEQQRSKFVECQREAYEALGWDPRRRVKLVEGQAMPTFEDVMNILRERRDGPSQTAYSKLVAFLDLGLFPSRAPETTFEAFLQDGVVLTMSGLDDIYSYVLSDLLVMRIHTTLRRGDQPRRLRQMLVFDEGWRIANSKHLGQLAREIRSFGVGLAIGTQNPKDMPETLVSCLRTQLFLFNKDPDNQRAIARAICNQTSGREANRIIEIVRNLARFQGLLVSEQYKDGVRVNVIPYVER